MAKSTKIVRYVKKRQICSKGRILYALSYSNRPQVMQLSYGPFSMTLLIVAYLFPCKGITGQFFVALFRKINNCNKKELSKTRNMRYFVAHMDVDKLNI